LPIKGKVKGGDVEKELWKVVKGESLASGGSYLYLSATCELMGDYWEEINKYDTEDDYITSYGHDEYFMAIATLVLSFGYAYGTGMDAKSFGYIETFFEDK
jgi:hypothetical protein